VKRTKHINLDKMRKARSARPVLKPLAVGIAAATLAGCSSDEEMIIVTSIDDCEVETGMTLEQCEVAYKKALAEAERTGPKYPTINQCESEFGAGQCRETSSGNFFMPFMAGWLVAEALDDVDDYYRRSYSPVYRYNRPYSTYHNRIMLADGDVIGEYGKKSYKVSKAQITPKPTVSKTVSRGGFGSVASAKSSWGGGSRSSSWGG